MVTSGVLVGSKLRAVATCLNLDLGPCTWPNIGPNMAQLCMINHAALLPAPHAI